MPIVVEDRTVPYRLAKHRDYLLKDRVPREEKIDAASAEQWALMGVPTPTFHSTAPMKAASEYARRAQQIFRERMVQPFTAR